MVCYPSILKNTYLSDMRKFPYKITFYKRYRVYHLSEKLIKIFWPRVYYLQSYFWMRRGIISNKQTYFIITTNVPRWWNYIHIPCYNVYANVKMGKAKSEYLSNCWPSLLTSLIFLLWNLFLFLYQFIWSLVFHILCILNSIYLF